MSFKRLKFKVQDAQHSGKIQRTLFDMGYTWSTNGQVVSYTNSKYLYTEDDGRLTHGGREDTYTEATMYTEAVLVESFSIKEINYVEFGGKRYNQEEFLAAVNQLTPV